MSRVVLPDPSGVVRTKPLSLYEIQKNVEDLEGRVQSIDAGTGGGATSYMTRTKPIGLRDWRTFDAEPTALPTSPANDDFGMAATAGAPIIGASASATTKSHNAGANVALPGDYVPGTNVTFRIRLKTAVAAQVSATIDLVAKLIGDTLGADICATAAQSTNATTTTLTDFDFVITGTSLVAGSLLNLVITDAIDDTGGAHASLSTIVSTKLIYSAYP